MAKSGWSMSSAWKTARRRGKQKLFEVSGASDAILDSEWEKIYEQFEADVSKLKKLHKQLLQVPPIYTRFASSMNDTANGIKAYFVETACPEDLHSSTGASSDAFEKLARHTWPNTNEAFATTVTSPVGFIISERVPDIRKKSQVRSGLKTDLSSYRRKLQKLEGNEKADPERVQVVKSKRDKCLAQYEALDKELKKELKEFHQQRFEMVRNQVQFALVAQMDIMKRSAELLQDALKPLQADAKKSILDSLARTHGSKGMRPVAKKLGWAASMKLVIDKKGMLGGTKAAPKAPPTGQSAQPTSKTAQNVPPVPFPELEPGADSLAPAPVEDSFAPVPDPAPVPAPACASDADVQNTAAEEGTEASPAPAPVATNPFGAMPVAAEEAEADFAAVPADDGPAEQAEASNPFGAMPTAAKEAETESAFVPAEDGPAEQAEEWVVGNFDFASEDDGDLPFGKGDRIKVLRKDGGWWEGELKGRVGMFPANYTSPS